MKITFVTYIYPYPERGFNPGIERVIGELSHSLANKGHEVNVITTFRNGGELEKELDQNVTIYRINDFRNLFGRIGSIFSLDLLSINYFIKKHKSLLETSDVIHAFTPFLINIPNVPVISHFHHDEQIREPIELLYVPTTKTLWNVAYKKSDQVISVSEYSSKYLLKNGVSKSKISIVPNGVDTNKLKPGLDISKLKNRFKEANILLYVGPIIKRKGLDYLIKSLPKILETHSSTILILVGGGDTSELEQLAISLNVEKNVFFEGFVADDKLPLYYNACDLFVFPSLQEGFGMVLIEAMACEKTVVASNSTAIPEVVGDAGVLVEPNNSNLIAEAIINLLTNNQKKQFLEKKAIKRVQDLFTWSKAADKLVDIYSN